MTRSRSTARRIIVTSLLALGLAAQAAPANAEPATTSETVPTMIVLDASGSMLNEDAPGKRIDAAKQAVHGLVDQLPGEAQLGLQVYGTGTGSNDSEKEAGCQDIKTLVPVGPVDKSAFLSAVDPVNASGFTPIGAALREAVKALPAEGPRAIVLVSDGIDTCAPPPPCDVAKELAAQDGLDLTVHTVGFLVDEQARADLQCIAEATGGTYADVNNADQLDQALQHKVEYAISGYQVEGIPVVGGETSDDPNIPLLTPGQYTETLPAQADSESEVTRYYRIDPPEGWTPHVAVTGILPAEQASVFDTASLKLMGTDARGACGGIWGAKTGGNDRKPLVASLKLNCKAETLLTVTRKGELQSDDEMPIEVVVRFEPPADASGVPEPEERPIPAPPARSTEVLPITGGSSFNNAAEIAPGQTYSGALQGSEYLYFKVPVTWGQQLAFQLTPDGRDGDPDWGIYTNVDLYDPMRQYNLSSHAQESWYGEEAEEESPPVVGGTDEPVRYTSSVFPLDGYYYLVISLFGLPGSEEIRQSFEFTVDAVGEIEPGPIYLTDGQTPSPRTSPAPAATQTPVPTPVEPQPAESNATALWVIGGVVAAGAVTGGALAIRRRRSA